jgi:uncharacterized protein (TIGR03545 family)
LRKKGLLFLGILFLLILLIYLIFTDRWLENQMESIGTTINGAKVELDGVDFSFLKLRIKWDRLQVTDPQNTWRNLFETGKAEFDLDLEPLLSKKYIIENFQLEGMKFNTKRSSDGKITKAETKKSKLFQMVEQKIKQETAQMPVFNLKKLSQKVNVDSLWELVDLHSPQKIDSLKSYYLDRYAHWDNRLKTLPSEQELNTISREVQAIQVDKINTIEEFQKTLSQVKDTYQYVDSLSKDVKSIRSEFEMDLKNVKENKLNVQKWINEDYQKILSLAQIPDLSMENMGKLLFGKRIISRIQNVLGYIGTARYYANKFISTKTEKEKPPRLKGQDIFFASRKGLPKFWIKQISVSGEAFNEMQISGKVEDIVSNQKIIDEMTVVQLSGTRRDQAGLKFNAYFDYRNTTPSENINLTLLQIPISNVKLSDFPLLPYRLRKGTGEIEATLDFKQSDFNFNMKMYINQMEFDFSDKTINVNPEIARLSRSILESLKQLVIQASASQTDNQFRFRVDTNLDELIGQKARAIMAEEVEKARVKIRSQVEQNIAQRQSELNTLITKFESDLSSKIEQVEKELSSQQELLKTKQKEIENQIELEKKKMEKKVEDKAKDLIKDIFKK